VTHVRAATLLVLLVLPNSVRGLVAQCPDGSPPPCRASRGAAIATPNSVAVLYLDNLSPDSADAFLSDGLSEEIASRLADVSRLSVKQASREGIRRLRETTPDYRVAAGRAFGVRYLVEGSLRRGGSRVRVDLRLINTANGFRVWGQTYDRAASDLLDLQEEIAQEVAASIAGQLAPGERTALAKRPTTNADAYEHFLRGNYYLAKRSIDGFVHAIEEYEAASRLDPRFSRAIARAGLTYELLYENEAGTGIPAPFALTRDSLLARGIAFADRAISQDSTVSDAWVTRAYGLSYLHPRTLDGVLAAAQRAVALDPHNAEVFHQYAFFLRQSGQDSAARAACLKSLGIEPERPITLSALGVLSFLARDYTDARRWLDSSLRFNPEFYWGSIRRARVRLMLGDPIGARTDAEMALREGGGDSSIGNALLVMASVRSGDTVTARALMRRVLRDLPDSDWQAFLEERLIPAAAFVSLGDREGALTLLERARPRGAMLWSGLRAPEFDPIRAERRFQRLVEESRPP
jgi:eukaryotic-like serine/threonine-protein kinase